MFKNFGTWLGIENENGQAKKEGESSVEDKGHQSQDITTNKPSASSKSEHVDKDAQPNQKAMGFSGKSPKSC